MSITLDTLLTRTPGVCGGTLRIDGTRITVRQIAAMHRQGASADDVGTAFPHLEPAAIYAALAYYHANRAEVEAELEAEAQEADALRARFGEG